MPEPSTRWKKCGAPNWTKPLPNPGRPKSSPAHPSRTKLRLIAVGRLRQGTKAGAEAELFSRYSARLRPALTVTEIPEASGPPHEAKRRENAALRAALPPNAHAVALDLGAPALDSEAFAVILRRWQSQQAPLCFLIGGAEGLDETTLAQASAMLSLGPMTWPHMLARVMLAEQLYRAQAIITGHPYHRSGRPGDATRKT